MPQYAVETLIKTLRLERGFTQAQLAEGICTRETVSRIERGEHLPDWYTFSSIMKRLGEDPYRYYNSIATKDDMRMQILSEEIYSCLRVGKYREVEKTVTEMESDPLFKNGIYRTNVLRFKAMYLSSPEFNNPETALAVLMESFRINRPNFEAEKIDTYILTSTEMSSVNTLAIIHNRLYGAEKGVEVWTRLRVSMEKGYIDEETKKSVYLPVLFNIAKNSNLLNNLNESLEACDTGIPLAKRYNDIILYCKFLAWKSLCLLKMDRKEEGIACCVQTCHLFLGLGEQEQYDDFKAEMEHDYNIKIEV